MILSAALFGAGHVYQGWGRAFMMGVFGWLLGWLAQRKKSLRPGILAHCWLDAISGALLFLGQRH
jgi:membrane protease YdiL (CAAX protease family)